MTDQEHDVAVIGGGLVGAAVAWGLARLRNRVLVLDEGDLAYRASRGNFALVWVQSKGLGMAPYAAWTIRSSDNWAGLADELRHVTGLDVRFERPGGFHLALGERELESRAALLRRLHDQPGMPRYDHEILGHEEIARMLPDIGPEVAGGSYCPLDGHVNSLRLFRALHVAMARSGVDYRPGHAVEAVEHGGGEFRIRAGTEFRAAKIVLAAGNGNARLGPMVGLDVPVRPQRGHVVVTEKTRPFLHYPTVTVRQTDEGGVMLGDSQEESGFDIMVGAPVLSVIADRAIRMFPRLAGLNVVRTWAALRVMTRDGFPIYDESAECPGAFVATCHSGVTLAANHALVLAPWIAEGKLPDELATFSAGRFHVSQAA